MATQEILKTIANNHGGFALFAEENKSKLLKLITDYFPDDPKIREMLRLAIQENIASRLLNVKDSDDASSKIKELKWLLHERTGFREKHAAQVVDCFAFALGMEVEPVSTLRIDNEDKYYLVKEIDEEGHVQREFYWTDEDKEWYNGTYKEGKKHGQGVYYSNFGVDKYERTWKFGKRNGHGVADWGGQKRYIGEWKNDRFHGNGELLLTQKGIIAPLPWGKNKNHEGKICFPFNVSYKGTFKDGKMNGQGEYYAENGEWYKGDWKNGKKHGVGEFHYVDGSRYKGEWENDLRHGQGEYHDTDGNWYKGIWENDNLQRKN